MAILFNINGLFAIDSSGAMEIGGAAGASTYVLMSNGAGNANSWYDVQSKFAEYLPLTGGTLTGNLAINGTNTLTVGGVTTLNDHLKVFNAWSSSDLTQNSFYAQNATDGFAFGVGTDVSTWFSYDSTTGIGVKPAIHVYNNASEIKIGVSDQPITMVGVTTFNANIAGTTGTFSGLVSGITPTAAANFATKAYVDGIGGGVSKIIASTNITISPVSGLGDVTISANDTNDNDYLTGLAFDTSNGVLTATVQNQSDVTVDLDGRYLTSYTVPLASSTVRGGMKIGFAQSGKNYPVELSSEKAYVNVPWTDSGDTTYSAGNGITFTGTPATVINADINYISYSGTNNFIVYGTQNSEGTTIPTGSQIVYADPSGTRIVNRGLVSDLPFTNNTGDLTSITLGNGLTGTNLTGPIPNILMSGTYTGTFNITDDLNVTDSARFEGTTNPITIGDGFGYGGSATICKHNADLYLQYNNGQTATNLQIGGGGTAVTIKDAQNSGFQIKGNGVTYFTGGDVGIGTTTPGVPLHVARATAGQALRLQQTGSNVYTEMQFQTPTGNMYIFVNSSGYSSYGGANATNFYTSNGAFAFHSNAGNNHFYIANGGDVGIGTTSPAVRLDFGNATGKAFHLYTSGTDYYGFNMLQYDSGPFSTNIFSGNGGEIKLRTVTGSTSAVTRLTVKANGNVGIGTTTPFGSATNEGLNVDKGGHSSIMIGDGVNDGGMIQSSDNSRRIIIGANVYDSPTASWGRFNASGAALVDVYGEGTAPFISLNVDAGTAGYPTSRLFIKSNGNVGIGTNTPDTTLHVQTNAVPGVSHAYYGSLIVENNGEAAIDIIGTSYSSIYFGDAAYPYSGGIVYNHSLNALDFRVNTNTNAMWIDSGGDVGIGVTGNIGYKLDVNGTGNFSSYLKLANAWSSSTLSANSFYVQNTTDGFAMGVGTGISSWFSWDNSAGQKRAIDVYNNGSSILVGAGGQNVQIQGTTVPLAPLSVDNNAIRMGRDWAIANRADIRLDSNGPSNPADILYGHTAAANQASWTGVYWALSSRGSSASNRFYFYRGGGNPTGSSEAVLMSFDPNLRVGINQVAPAYALDVTGVIRATSDILAYSDARVKENIKTIDNALEKTTKLRGVSYTRNDIEDKSTKIGVIAQEVLEVLPEVVSKDNEGKYSVSYGNIVGVLIEAIKELEARVKELENK